MLEFCHERDAYVQFEDTLFAQVQALICNGKPIGLRLVSVDEPPQDLREAIGTQRGTLPHFTAALRFQASAHNFKQKPKYTKNAVFPSFFLLCFCTTILCDFLDHIWTKARASH